ncbi:MAG: OmpA family protein [Cyanobacteria bacterium P01_A01_bin.84]
MKKAEDSVVLNNLIDVLMDMEIIDSNESKSSEPIVVPSSAVQTVDNSELPKQIFKTKEQTDPIPLKISEFKLSEIDLETNTIIDLENPCKSELPFKSLSASDENSYNQNPARGLEGKCTNLKQLDSSKEKIAAFQKLQDILVGSELTQLNNLITYVKDSIDKLESQIYDSEKLINLLLPTIHELLRRNIAESKEELVEVILPLVDRAIEARVEQDKDVMGSILAAAIPSAISKQVNINAEEIADAIAPTIGKAMKKQVDIEQDAVVDALYPIIGNTIVKYMGETIEAINNKIEDTLSIEGIQRKISARLQGVSEAELIVKESVFFKVQAIFLIHKSSGLIIADVQPQDAEHLESEMIAGMLTAIRSFANDCIHQSGMVAELDAIDYGTSKIVLEVAGYCYLAIITQGEPSPAFIKRMRHTLTQIVKSHDRFINKFDGDPDTVPLEINQLLATLTNSNIQDKKAKGGVSPLILLVSVVFGAIAIPWGIWQYYSSFLYSIETKSLGVLAQVPELAVYRLNTKIENNQIKLTGKLPNQLLRSKAEKIVQTNFPEWSINNQILAVEVPADPILTAAEVKRVTKVLNQVEGTNISTQFLDRRVIIDGSIIENTSSQNIVTAFEQIPGVKTVSSTLQITGLSIDTRLYFQHNSIKFLDSDSNNQVEEVLKFLNKYPKMKIKIVGYSYSENIGLIAQQLALKRAKTVQRLLISRGIVPSRIQVSKSTRLPPGIEKNQSAWLKRCVTFEVVK